MVAEVLFFFASIPYEKVMSFSWDELKNWHAQAVRIYKATKGIE
ncbi:MAG: hypothetical protein ACRC5H_10795 [Treponemataceae bacterium]